MLFDNQKVWIYNNFTNLHVEYIVEQLSFSNKLIIKLKTLETRDSLKYVKNSSLFVSKQDVPARENGANYLFDYLECKAADEFRIILGIIKEILDIPGNYVFVVKDRKKEYLVPVSDNVIRFFDFDSSILTINKIEGLFD